VSNPAIAEELKKRLEETWAKMLPLMLRRLDAINRAHRALLDGALDDSLRAEAAHEAHKLAGSLGVFGLQEGSKSALEIERVLANMQTPRENEISELEKHVKKLQSQICAG
jgi:HPt (histidine-containing phosphotransfer) domain-containing protein